MAGRRATKWALGAGIPLVILAAIIVFWSWDWFIPAVAARASAQIRRSVSIQHLHVQLGRVITVVADGVTIGNPPHWTGPPFASAQSLTVRVDAWQYLFHHQLIITLIALQDPRVAVTQAADDKANYRLQLASSSSGGDTKIGDLRITGGHVHVVLARLKANFDLDVATRENDENPQLVVAAHGTYDAAPIVGHMIGGALLSLRDPTNPWPINLQLANGDTHISLAGTLQDPLHLRGANLKLLLAGQDMAALTPLTGIPIAQTPPYRLTVQLDFHGGHIQFRDFAGRVGKSDLEGTIDVDPGKQRPIVHAVLQSRQVDLADLGGFIGTNPGRTTTPGQTPQQRAKLAQASESQNLLPAKPISLPKLQFADIVLRYRGEHILGQSIPLDNLVVDLNVGNGAVNLHPVSFGVGVGSIQGNVSLVPENKLVHAKADIDFDRVDVSRLMAATHTFEGAGTISGSGHIDTVGNSLAAMLGNGEGGFQLGMVGGDLSAILVDLSGLEFGNAVLSALGVPQHTPVKCMVDDMALQNGQLTLRPLILDTGEAIVTGTGGVNLKNEALDLSLRTQAKHFSIGSLPAPINITGTLKHPTIRPGAELAVRGGLMAGLAAVFPPLAVLPTIQLGVGNDTRCQYLLEQAKAGPNGAKLPSPDTQQSAR